MSYDSRSSGAGAALALFLLLLVLIGFVGAGFLWTVRSGPAPAAAMAPVAGGSGTPGAAHASYSVQPKSCVRLADGDYQVTLTLTLAGDGVMDQFALGVTTAEGAPCAIESGALLPPFPAQADVLVRVPQAAASEGAIPLRVSTKVHGRQGFAGSYGSSRSRTLSVPVQEADGGETAVEGP